VHACTISQNLLGESKVGAMGANDFTESAMNI
jgi:hypothetical protein